MALKLNTEVDILAQTSLIQVRVDDEFKKEVDSLFADLGFDTPTAIRIFLKQAIEWRGLPFEVNKKAKVSNDIIYSTNSAPGKMALEDFSYPEIDTRGFKFNREEANERR